MNSPKAGLSAGLGAAESAATSGFRAGLNKAARDIADSHVTTGQVIDAAGNKIGKPVLGGNNEISTPAIEKYLREIGAEMPRSGVVHPAAQHV